MPKKYHETLQSILFQSKDFQEFLYIGKIIQWDLIPFGVGLLTHNLGSDKDIDVRTKGKNSQDKQFF